MDGLITATLVVAGCNDATTPAAVTGPSIQVRFNAEPLADVEVRLHAVPSGAPLAKAVSANDGTATFVDLPSPEPDAYYVSMVSLGDGGWMLDTKFSEPGQSGFQLKPLTLDDGQTIDLPRGSVQSLSP